jgi:hypothetical protein
MASYNNRLAAISDFVRESLLVTSMLTIATDSADSSCCEATLHSRRLLHELLRNSLNAQSVRFIATKNEKAVRLDCFCFGLYNQFRCHGEKVNKIKGF